jgi:hypothetical protein
VTITLTPMTDRERLAAVLMSEQGFDDKSIAFYRAKSGTGSNREYWAEALETADAILDAGFSRGSAVGTAALTEALETAEGWAEHGYTEGSKSYWTGMRDTIRVVLGITTEAPTGSATDPAAFTIIGAQHRLNRKTR